MTLRPLDFPTNPTNPVTERRLDTLERRSLTRPQIEQPVSDTSVNVRPWGVDGALSTGISNPWPFFDGDDATLGVFYAYIPSTTTTATVVEARRNGVTVAGSELTIPAGTGQSASVLLGEAFASGDYYEIAVTTAGAGAEDLQTFSRFE